tara:strand:- start:155 stop:547 length:393 start_codon:yes stop_codon:yes gene_type:complete
MTEEKPRKRDKDGSFTRIPKAQIEKSRDQVIKLSQLGCTDVEIASIIGMSEYPLKKYLRAELDEGRGNLRASLRKAQVEAAIRDKNPTMLIWLGKCYLGQKEPKKELEHSGAITVEKVVFSKNGKDNKNT